MPTRDSRGGLIPPSLTSIVWHLNTLPTRRNESAFDVWAWLLTHCEPRGYSWHVAHNQRSLAPWFVTAMFCLPTTAPCTGGARADRTRRTAELVARLHEVVEK